MADALKNHFGVAVPGRIATMIAAVHPGFDRATFVAEALPPA